MAQTVKPRNKPDKTAPVEFHPLADIFPLLEGEEFEELVKDVKANGLQQPIVLHQGKILDGRNRYRACLEAGVVPRWDEFPGGDPHDYVISANVHRRHLTSKQKRELIAKVLELDPGRSDNAIAKKVGVSQPTVSAVRSDLEARSKILNVKTRTDTKGRQQPAKKPAKLEGVGRTGHGSGSTTTSAAAIACRMLTDLYAMSVMKKVAPAQVAQELKLNEEQRTELLVWVRDLLKAFAERAAS